MPPATTDRQVFLPWPARTSALVGRARRLASHVDLFADRLGRSRAAHPEAAEARQEGLRSAAQRYCETAVRTMCFDAGPLPRHWVVSSGKSARTGYSALLDAASVLDHASTAVGGGCCRPGWPAYLARTGPTRWPMAETRPETGPAFFADRVGRQPCTAATPGTAVGCLLPEGKLSFDSVRPLVLSSGPAYDDLQARRGGGRPMTARAAAHARGLPGRRAKPPCWCLGARRPPTGAQTARSYVRCCSAEAMPMAPARARVWGAQGRLFEQVLPLFSSHQLAHLVRAASP